MALSGKNHYDAMIIIMYYCVMTSERGLVLKSCGDWDGISPDYNLKI